jgi:hypothetical protein
VAGAGLARQLPPELDIADGVPGREHLLARRLHERREVRDELADEPAGVRVRVDAVDGGQGGVDPDVPQLPVHEAESGQAAAPSREK